MVIFTIWGNQDENNYEENASTCRQSNPEAWVVASPILMWAFPSLNNIRTPINGTRYNTTFNKTNLVYVQPHVSTIGSATIRIQQTAI